MEEQEIKQLEQELDDLWTSKPKFTVIKKFLETKLPKENYISSGSSRMVWKISDTKVLKVAKNQKGVAQNEVEADWYLKQTGVGAEWYDVSDNAIWIESEFCQKIKKSDFLEKEGYTFDYICECIRYYANEIKPSRYYRPSKPEGYDSLWDKEDFNESLLGRVFEYMSNFDVPSGDLVRLTNYGINQKGQIVLTDTGLNSDVEKEYYSRKESLSVHKFLNHQVLKMN